MKAKVKPTLDTIAVRIDEHLKKMEKTRRFYKPTAELDGQIVKIKYCSYSVLTHAISMAGAKKYLAWLDAGNTGEHWKVI